MKEAAELFKALTKLSYKLLELADEALQALKEERGQ